MLLAVALTLTMAPAAASGQPAAQPDLMIVGRGGYVLAGEGLYNEDGVGQQRSVIVGDHYISIGLLIRNEGSEPVDISISAPGPTDDFRLRYENRRADITDRVVAGTHTEGLGAGTTESFAVFVAPFPTAPLGARLRLLVTATGDGWTDAVLIKITNVSTPE